MFHKELPETVWLPAALLLLWYSTGLTVRNNGYDIALARRLLQHSSAATIQRYIGIETATD